MDVPKKQSFLAWLSSIFRVRQKENRKVSTLKAPQTNLDKFIESNAETKEVNNLSSKTLQNSTVMKTTKDSPKDYLSPKKSTRSFEEIGLLFGLANKASEKKTYLDSIDADITDTRKNLNDDIEKLKKQFNELLSSTKNIRQELRSLINDLESNRNSTVIKLSKTIRALLMESDFDSIEKKEIINKVLDEGLSAVVIVKESILRSQKTIDEMINSFLASSPLSQINTLYESYLEELKEHQIAKTELQKGFAAGLAIKRNLDEIENQDNPLGDEEE